MRFSTAMTRATCWALTLAMPVVWTGAMSAPARAQNQTASDDAKRVAALDRFVELGKRELKNVADANPDPATQAAALDFDVDKVFAFVRDTVKSEPYAGVLRGARGALASHSGNAADKALLLKAMLEAGGTTARLVAGTLSPDRATAVVDQFLAADSLAGPLGELLGKPADDGSLADFCGKAGIDAATMQTAVGDARKTAAELQQAAQTQAADAAAFLQAQLAANNIKIGQTSSQWRNELAARVKSHVWVQYQNADGKWIDLDPTLADAKPGRTMATDPKPVIGDLPDRHVVTVSLIYTHGDPNKPQADTILSVPLNADEALFSPADFAVTPVEGLPSTQDLMQMTREERVKKLGDVTKFQAIIRSGERSYCSKGFDLKGNLFDITADGRMQGVGELNKSMGGAFGGLGGGGDDSAKPAAGSFESLAITIRFEGPKQQPAIRPQTRVLLSADDLKGDHVLSPLVDWQILIQPQVITAAMASTGQLKNTIDAVDPVLAVLKTGDPKNSAGAIDNLMRRTPAPYPLMPTQWSMFRQAALATLLKQSPDVALLWDAPQVVISERRFCFNKTSGHTCNRSRIDIVHNGLTLIPRKDDAAAVTVALRQGVYDTVAERVILEKLLPDGLSMTAAASLDAVRIAGGKLKAYSANANALSPKDQAFVTTSETGREILATAGGDGKPAEAWWSIDPRTGSVVGRSTGGYGGAMVENAMLQQLAGGAVCFLAAGKDAYNTKDNDTHGWQVNLLQFAACTIATQGGVMAVGMGASGTVTGILFYANLAITGGITIFK